MSERSTCWFCLVSNLWIENLKQTFRLKAVCYVNDQWSLLDGNSAWWTFISGWDLFDFLKRQTFEDPSSDSMITMWLHWMTSGPDNLVDGQQLAFLLRLTSLNVWSFQKETIFPINSNPLEVAIDLSYCFRGTLKFKVWTWKEDFGLNFSV